MPCLPLLCLSASGHPSRPPLSASPLHSLLAPHPIHGCPSPLSLATFTPSHFHTITAPPALPTSPQGLALPRDPSPLKQPQPPPPPPRWHPTSNPPSPPHAHLNSNLLLPIPLTWLTSAAPLPHTTTPALPGCLPDSSPTLPLSSTPPTPPPPRPPRACSSPVAHPPLKSPQDGGACEWTVPVCGGSGDSHAIKCSARGEQRLQRRVFALRGWVDAVSPGRDTEESMGARLLSGLCLLLWVSLVSPDRLGSENPDCGDRREDPACPESLVAVPPESSCDGAMGCRLHFLGPEEQAPPEEVRDTHQEPQQEFKQTLKQAGGDGAKQQGTRSKNVMDRLTLAEASVMAVAGKLQRAQEESRLNFSSMEERLNSLVVLLLGILSGCELPCNESVLKLSLLESRRLKTLETKEELQLPLKGVRPMGTPVESSEKSDRSFPRDCAEIYKQGIRDNGIYTIQPIPLKQPFEAYCDMVTDGGGWTVFQRRQDGSVDFNRTWQEYKHGFGNLQGEHWLGNENLHGLTRVGQHALRIELEDWYGVKRHAIYKKFKVASEQNKYRLTSREYQGNAGNALSYSRNYNHDHKHFTTADSDNDNYQTGNCGTYYGAGWWFDSCLAANLNGKYHKGRYIGLTDGIYWGTWYILTDKRTKQKYSFKKVEMKTRIVNA
ncbi:uncharacterized protein [Ambystoma mexicanum]|uniref:uncharacterized protein n=1 Tax=Ambystoma mexicanum TaxID=8296 RepID=UPI0037E79E83